MDGSTKTRLRPISGKRREERKDPKENSTSHTILVVAVIGDAAAASIGQCRVSVNDWTYGHGDGLADTASNALIHVHIKAVKLTGIGRVYRLQPPLWLHLHHVRRASGRLSLPHVRRITLVCRTLKRVVFSVCLGQWFLLAGLACN